MSYSSLSHESTVLPESFQFVARILGRRVTVETHVQQELKAQIKEAAAAHPACRQSQMVKITK